MAIRTVRATSAQHEGALIVWLMHRGARVTPPDALDDHTGGVSGGSRHFDIPCRDGLVGGKENAGDPSSAERLGDDGETTTIPRPEDANQVHHQHAEHTTIAGSPHALHAPRILPPVDRVTRP